MQVPGTGFSDAAPQPLPQFFRPPRSGKQALNQRSQVKSRATDHDRERLAAANFLNNLSGRSGIPSRGCVGGRFDDVKQMMGNTCSLLEGRLRRADRKFTNHGEGITVHNLAF